MRSSLASMLVLGLIACGGGSGDDGATVDAGPSADAPPAADRLLPLAVGNTWTYDVTPVGMPTERKTTSVQAFEDIGGQKAGTMAYRVRTERVDGVTVSWQGDIGVAIIRHREQVFDATTALSSEQYYNPGKLRVDDSPAHTTVGAHWIDSYTELSRNATTNLVTSITKNETWTVEAAAEQITVPAGTFSCVRLHRTGTATQADKRYWFARGVGKVKEVGDGSTEELVSYTVH